MSAHGGTQPSFSLQNEHFWCGVSSAGLGAVILQQWCQPEPHRGGTLGHGQTVWSLRDPQRPKAGWHGRCPRQGKEDITCLSLSCSQAGGRRQEEVRPVLAPGEGFPGVLWGPDHHQPGRRKPQPLQENHPGDPQLRGAWPQLPGGGVAWRHQGSEKERGSNPPAFPRPGSGGWCPTSST